jgi:anti-sigma regulatory factor (Ser/Thr protein kinase)/DNA-binding MarR family transcriptional regulator
MTENDIKILVFLKKQESITAPQLAEYLHLSRQRAFQLLAKLVHRGKVIQTGERRGRRYSLPNVSFEVRDRIELALENKNLKEHEVLMDIRDRFVPLKLASENVKSIFDYAFSEMLNNAIEHSESSRMAVSVLTSGHTADGSPSQFSFIIRDYGIGAFRNLMKKRALTSELEAMQDVLKGKVTTAPEAHSGQGIFFTSKAADRFSLRSYGWEMRVDNNVPDIFFLADDAPLEGTEVRFDIDYHSSRHLIDVFRAFESEDGSQDFDRTEIHVRLFIHGTIHVSRSQARRILVGLDKFKRVTLDFDRVPTIGQAFADEIFRVFRLKSPHVRIQVINANEAVRFMIDRVDSKSPE